MISETTEAHARVIDRILALQTGSRARLEARRDYDATRKRVRLVEAAREDEATALWLGLEERLAAVPEVRGAA